MSHPQDSVTFSFVDPTDALVRMLMLGPLAANQDMLEQVNHNLIDQPLDWCVPKPEPVTQDHHRQTNDLKGSAIKVYRLRDKKGKEK